MTRCLDEGKLQSYFDGELSIEMMESVTSHLASCVTCAAAARELEEESALFMSALGAEFEASVPTERLRERINEAVLGDRLAIAQSTEKASDLAGFFSGLLNFGTQRTLGYASLVAVVAFAAIFGVVKMRSTTNPATDEIAKTIPEPAKGVEVGVVTPPSKAPRSQPTEVSAGLRPKKGSAATYRPVKFVPNSTPKTAPVKLFPGER